MRERKITANAGKKDDMTHLRNSERQIDSHAKRVRRPRRRNRLYPTNSERPNFVPLGPTAYQRSHPMYRSETHFGDQVVYVPHVFIVLGSEGYVPLRRVS